jgi:hypothetical protein
MENVRVQPAAGPAPARSRRQHRATKHQPLTRASLDGRSNAARLFDRIVTDITADLGGKQQLSTVALALIEAFAGSCITLDALNARLLLGEQIDLSDHAQVVSAMVRVASRLGLSRSARDVTPDPLTYAREHAP